MTVTVNFYITGFGSISESHMVSNISHLLHTRDHYGLGRTNVFLAHTYNIVHTFLQYTVVLVD